MDVDVVERLLTARADSQAAGEEAARSAEEKAREDAWYGAAVLRLAVAPRHHPRGESENFVRSWKMPDRRLSPEDQRLQKRVTATTIKRVFGVDVTNRGKRSR